MKNNRPWLSIIVILILIIICLICAGAGLMLYIVSHNTPASPTNTSGATGTAPSTPPAAEKVKWEITSVTIKKATSTATVDITYPQIKNYPDGNAMADFNAAVQNDMQTASADTLSMPASGSSLPDSIALDYTVPFKSDTFVSIVMQGSSYGGGAHPNAAFYTYNYDLAKAKKLALGDLFQPGSLYLKTISDYCIKELNSRGLGDTGMVESGAGPAAENFIYFDVATDGKGIEIIFPPYQVGPYAIGTQTVSIPRAQFSSMLKPEYAPLFK